MTTDPEWLTPFRLHCVMESCTTAEERHAWEQFKCFPMTVRLKPNRRARIKIDLSYPHNETLGKGRVCSPNMGMANYKEFEPVRMAGDVQWRRCKVHVHCRGQGGRQRS